MAQNHTENIWKEILLVTSLVRPFYFYRDIICRHCHISHLHPNIGIFTLLTFSLVCFLHFFPFCWHVLAWRSVWPSLPLALASFLTPLHFLSVFPLACSVLETLRARYFLYGSWNLFSSLAPPFLFLCWCLSSVLPPTALLLSPRMTDADRHEDSVAGLAVSLLFSGLYTATATTADFSFSLGEHFSVR